MQNQSEIITPQRNDVLKGRGVIYNSHHGNVQFRSIVNDLKVEYVYAPKHRKPLYAENIVLKIKSMDPPGRFLIKNAGKWKEINDKAAMAKTRQALREGAKDILVNGEQRPSSIGSEADFSSMYVVNSSGGPNSSNRSSSLRSSIVSATGSIGNNPSVEGSVWSNEQEEEHSPKKRRRVSVRDEDIPVVNINQQSLVVTDILGLCKDWFTNEEEESQQNDRTPSPNSSFAGCSTRETSTATSSMTCEDIADEGLSDFGGDFESLLAGFGSSIECLQQEVNEQAKNLF